MSERDREKKRISNLESELYLLIAKFLTTGPCTESAKILREEIEKHQLLPKRIDWLGNEHSRTFNELNDLSQIANDHLLKICARVGPILDKEIPPTVPGLTSLLGVGRQSFLRTKEELQKPKCPISTLIARKNGMPLFPSQAAHSAYPPNITQVLMSRELSGSLSIAHTFTPKIYARQQNYRRLLGHLSSVYCCLFDRTGKYIFTGADDLLVKIWSALDGRLLASLRGHSAEITDMAVNYENTLLAAGSCDKTIRVWCLRTTAPVAVLNAHTGMVTSLQFCPYPKKEDQLLISTGNDGCVCFWQWNPRNNTFNPKPLKFTERNKPGAQMICSAFSKGGMFLATGSTDHNVRVYNIANPSGPVKILEKEAHADRVDSIQFSNSDCRFITGSKDGTASIWQYKRQTWTSIQLKMTTKLPGQADEPEDVKLKLRVTMVGWTLDDSRVITAVSDHTIKIWDSNTGALRFILKGHEDEVFVLEPHPIDPRVFLSSGHDGRIILWDLVTGTIIKNHFNLIEGQGHGAVFDCKFSPDGLTFASTDSHGHLSIFGFGAADRYKKVPEEQFFHTDYRPLIRDIHHHVLDEQTQTAPHLLPPPFLVDIDGNPYPPHLQRLVPGRERCNDSQLVPYVAVSADGEAEILEPVRAANDSPPNRPTIDDMIERLQQEQNVEARDNSSESGSRRGPLESPRRGASENDQNDAFSPRSGRSQAAHSRVGLRRTGDVEGVQSLGNWQTRGQQTDAPSWGKRVVVKPMQPAISEAHMRVRISFADHEMNIFNQERKWRSQAEISKEPQNKHAETLHWSKRPGQRSGTRSTTQGSTTTTSQDVDSPETEPPTSTSTTSETEEDKEDNYTSSDDSGDYSDWEKKYTVKKKADVPPSGSSEPSTSGLSRRPTRMRRRPRVLSEENEEESEEELDDTEEESPANKKQSKTPLRGRKPTMNGIKLDEKFKPPEWLTDVIPHKAPYVPQIGDEVMYFRQGHELYVQAVKRNRIYDICMKDQPWRKCDIRDQEVAIIEDITFENRPPRLCCLKLALSNPASKQDESILVKYHDMEDVIEFIILKQNYDQAMYYDWKSGDRFRSEIEKAWWLGTILTQKPINPRFPDSMFQCFVVKWDNGETEEMSPWDFERIDAERLPAVEGGSVDILPEERLLMMYIPEPHEWSVFGRDHDCDRIARGLSRIMQLSIAEPFTLPVNLNEYPAYAIVVEYPMDLGTIKARLQNRYYRRLAALKFDVQFIGINALKFNEPTSRIVKQAKCVVDLCLRFIGSSTCNDPMTFYHEMMEAKQSRSQDSQSELDVLCSESDSDGEHTSTKIKKKKNSMQSNKRACPGNQKYTSSSWKEQCMSLIDSMFEWDDSTPFRYPVNLTDYPNYRDIIDCPMDLTTVRERLHNNYYNSPTDFCKDVRLVFQNSRNYNINKKSRIYSMTIRLSAMFEEHIRGIVSDWKSAVKYEEKIRNNQYVSNRRRPLLVQEAGGVNVGASTSRGFATSLPSTSRTDIHKTSINRILNVAYSEPGTSRSKMSNGLGQKKNASKSLEATIKAKLLKRSKAALSNGIAKKKIANAAKTTMTTRKRSGNLQKRLHSSFEGSQSDFDASSHSNVSSEAESEGSHWGTSRSKKRPKYRSETDEELVFRGRPKKQRKEAVPHIKRTFRRKVNIKRQPRLTTRSSSCFKNSATFSSSLRTHTIRSSTYSNLNSSRSITPDRTKSLPRSITPDRTKSLRTRKSKAVPVRRAHLRRVSVQPRRYANSGTTSDSDDDAFVSQSQKLRASELQNQKLRASESQSQKLKASELQSQKLKTNELPSQKLKATELQSKKLKASVLQSKKYDTSNSASSKSDISESQSTKGESSSSSRDMRDKIGIRKRKIFKESSNSSPNSESDEVSSPLRRRGRKSRGRSALKVNSPRSPRLTRNRGKKTVQYREDSNEENYDSGNSQPMLSLSSRGRLRSSFIKEENKLQHVMSKKLLQKSLKNQNISLRKTYLHAQNLRHTLISEKPTNTTNSSQIGNKKRFPKLNSIPNNQFESLPNSPCLRSSSSLEQNKLSLEKSSSQNEIKFGSKSLKVCDKKKNLSPSITNKDKLTRSITTANSIENTSRTKNVNQKTSNSPPNIHKVSPSALQTRSNKLTKDISKKFSQDSVETELHRFQETKQLVNNVNKNDGPHKLANTLKRKVILTKNRNYTTRNPISSHTRSAANTNTRKSKECEIPTSELKEESSCSNQSKENSVVKRKYRLQSTTQTSKESTKRETRNSGRRTVMYTEDIDSPYFSQILENGDHFEFESTTHQTKENLTSSTQMPFKSETNAKQRQLSIRCKVKSNPAGLKRKRKLRSAEGKPLKQLSNGIETRNRGERTLLYNDESDFSDEFENLEPHLLTKSY